MIVILGTLQKAFSPIAGLGQYWMAQNKRWCK